MTFGGPTLQNPNVPRIIIGEYQHFFTWRRVSADAVKGNVLTAVYIVPGDPLFDAAFDMPVVIYSHGTGGDHTTFASGSTNVPADLLASSEAEQANQTGTLELRIGRSLREFIIISSAVLLSALVLISMAAYVRGRSLWRKEFARQKVHEAIRGLARLEPELWRMIFGLTERGWFAEESGRMV